LGSFGAVDRRDSRTQVFSMNHLAGNRGMAATQKLASFARFFTPSIYRVAKEPREAEPSRAK